MQRGHSGSLSLRKIYGLPNEGVAADSFLQVVNTIFRLWRSVMFLLTYMLFDLRFWVVMWGVGDD